MPRSEENILDYEPVTPGRKQRVEDPSFTKAESLFEESPQKVGNTVRDHQRQAQPSALSYFPEKNANWLVRRGHTVSFIGVFVFTIAVYLRPYELIPALMPLKTMAFWIAVATILVFVPTQLGLEGNLTSRPREVNLLLLLALAVLLSVPFADDPVNSFNAFVDFLKVVLMFIVMVNVIRTENRWKLLLLLLLIISCFLSASALRDYSAGLELVEDIRVTGRIGNMFDNPNDMALHLVTMVPISVGLLLSTRNRLLKVFGVSCAILMIGGIVVTFSRGGLVGLIFALGVLVWKLRRRNSFLVIVATIVLGGAFIMFAPGGIASRFSTIFDQDEGSSVSARKDDLKRSLLVTLRHPLFGIGIGNFILRSNRAVATHNSYTQVSAEVGIAAMALYVLFIITPLKRLRSLERETMVDRKKSRYYYLAIGVQASIVGYMVCSFFASVAFLWYVYYLVALGVCLTRLYEIKQGITVSGTARSNSVDRFKQGAERSGILNPQPRISG